MAADGQKREAKACLEAAGRLWENMHSNQSYARRKEDDVYKVHKFHRPADLLLQAWLRLL